MYKIGWFSTGRDKAARDLLTTVKKAIERKEINAEILFVFSNRKYGESRESDQFLDLVKEMRLEPLITLSSANFQSDLITPDLKKNFPEKRREEYDKIVMSFLAPFEVDIYVLAGYMLIVSPLMCSVYNMINLHPAKPGGPKGSWQEVIQQLIENRERESGVMLHLVTPELDAGPPITYCTFSINPEEKEASDIIRGQQVVREPLLLLETLRLLAEGFLKIKNGKLTNRWNEFYPKDYPGVNLTKDIEKLFFMRLRGIY